MWLIRSVVGGVLAVVVVVEAAVLSSLSLWPPLRMCGRSSSQ